MKPLSEAHGLLKPKKTKKYYIQHMNKVDVMAKVTYFLMIYHEQNEQEIQIQN